MFDSRKHATASFPGLQFFIGADAIFFSSAPVEILDGSVSPCRPALPAEENSIFQGYRAAAGFCPACRRKSLAKV
jgi:hypothetical protein